jgi:NAD(P)-dependent dehydrogenase (short-subunit alcohol dehydrogenase family)
LSLIQKAGGQGLFVRGDVSEESEIEALVAKTLERFGQLRRRHREQRFGTRAAAERQFTNL